MLSPLQKKNHTRLFRDSFVVESSVGHIRDLPKKGGMAIDIDNGFKPKYEISKDKEKLFKI